MHLTNNAPTPITEKINIQVSISRNSTTNSNNSILNWSTSVAINISSRVRRRILPTAKKKLRFLKISILKPCFENLDRAWTISSNDCRSSLLVDCHTAPIMAILRFCDWNSWRSVEAFAFWINSIAQNYFFFERNRRASISFKTRN